MEVAVGNLARQILDRQPHCVDVLVAIADLLLELLDRLGARCQLVLEWRQLQLQRGDFLVARGNRPVAFLHLGDQRVDPVAAARHLGHLLGKPGLEVLQPELELAAQHGIFGAQAVAVGLQLRHGGGSCPLRAQAPEAKCICHRPRATKRLISAARASPGQGA